MFESFSSWPLLLSGLLFVGLAVALGAGLVACAHAVVQRATVERWFKGLLPNVGAAMTAGCIVWLGLLANAELRDIDEATQAVNAEAMALRALDSTREVTAPTVAQAVGQSLRRYAGAVVHEEWPRMSSDGAAPAAVQAISELRVTVLRESRDEVPQVRDAFLSSLRDLEAARDKRLTLAEERIPGVVWLSASAAAFIVLLFSALVHAGHARGGAGYIMGTLLAVLLALNLFTLIVVDRPFVGRIAVSAQPLTEALPPLPAPLSR